MNCANKEIIETMQVNQNVKIECWIKYITDNTVMIETEEGVLMKIERSKVKIIIRHDGFIKSIISMRQSDAQEYGLINQ